MIVRLDTLATGTRFRWANTMFELDAREPHMGSDGVTYRGVIYRQDTGFAANGDAGLMPAGELVEVVS